MWVREASAQPPVAPRKRIVGLEVDDMTGFIEMKGLVRYSMFSCDVRGRSCWLVEAFVFVGLI